MDWRFPARMARRRCGYTGLAADDATGKALPASLRSADRWGPSGTVDPGEHRRGPGPDHHRSVRAAGQAHRVRWRGGDEFGDSVAISGNTMVVGAPVPPTVGGTAEQGAAYVFTESGSGWTACQTAKLTASDGAGRRRSALGFDQRQHGGGRSAGHGSPIPPARPTCSPSPAAGWADMTQTAELTASGERHATTFRPARFRSAATRWWSGRLRHYQRLARGRPTCSPSPAPAGPNMIPTAELTASPTWPASIALGTRFRSAATRWWSERRRHGRRQQPTRGPPYVFTSPAPVGGEHDPETAKLIASDGTANDYFGTSVSISGKTVVVGAAAAAGVARGRPTCSASPAAVGTHLRATPDRRAHLAHRRAGDGFGTSVAIGGNTVVVGASCHGRQQQPTRGRPTCSLEPASGWADTSQTAELTASAAAAGDFFGGSVSIGGDTLVVGAGRYRRRQRRPGGGLRASPSEPARLGDTTQTAKLTAILTAGDDIRQLGFDQRQHDGGRAR